MDEYKVIIKTKLVYVWEKINWLGMTQPNLGHQRRISSIRKQNGCQIRIAAWDHQGVWSKTEVILVCFLKKVGQTLGLLKWTSFAGFSFSGPDPNIHLGFKPEIHFICHFSSLSNWWLLVFIFLQDSAVKTMEFKKLISNLI